MAETLCNNGFKIVAPFLVIFLKSSVLIRVNHLVAVSLNMQYRWCVCYRVLSNPVGG